jgi:hypothetical protein
MRSKLKLQLEDLSVESFDTSTSEKPKGTVFGEQCTCPTACTCPGCPTCDASCDDTCDGTCDSCFSCGGTCGQYTCYHSCDLWCTEGATCDANGYGTCGMRQC